MSWMTEHGVGPGPNFLTDPNFGPGSDLTNFSALNISTTKR
jgi:hypothetical protein